MWFQRLAISWHKLFWTQFLIGTKIKASNKTVLQTKRILDLTEKWGSQQLFWVLGQRQKWVKLPPTFFKLFINFLVDYHLLSHHLVQPCNCKVRCHNCMSRFHCWIGKDWYNLLIWHLDKYIHILHAPPVPHS